MKLRHFVALLATTALVANACGDHKDSEPAPGAGAAAVDKDKAATTEQTKPAAAAEVAPPSAANKAEQNKAEQAKAEQNKAEQAKAEQAKAEQNKAEANKAEANKAEQAAAEPAGGEVAAGGDAIKRAVTLQKSALAILKSNTKDPKAAAAALEAFQKENADAIATLEQDLTAVQKKLKDDPAAAMEMVSKYADEIGEITKLTMELAGEAPALLEDPAVAAALQKLSPNPGQEDERGDAETEVAGEGGGLSEQDEALLEVGLGHQEKMLAILEQHAADPAKAGAELTKYAEANAAELNKLAEVQRRLANDTEAAMSFAKKNMARVSAMAMKVSKLMKDHPTLLDDPKIVEAMAKLSGD